MLKKHLMVEYHLRKKSISAIKPAACNFMHATLKFNNYCNLLSDAVMPVAMISISITDKESTPSCGCIIEIVTEKDIASWTCVGALRLNTAAAGEI